MTDGPTDIRLPPRVRLREIDSMTGSYPTLSRLGDPDRSGRFGSRFDDSKTIIFHSSTQINLPTTLHVGSQFLMGNTSSLSTLGTVRKGIADEFVTHITGGDDLRPFDESRVPIGQYNDSFYRTGTLESAVGFGFSSPLFSKTSFSIDLGVRSTTTLQLSASTVADPAISGGGRTGSFPMAYYNFALKKWERIGRGVSYDYVDGPSVAANSINQMIGFSPSPYGDTNPPLTVVANASQSGVPMDNFGFPIHQKFHATESQAISLSDVLDRPFLLEKIVYEFTASFSGSRNYKLEEEQFFNTFFILNQRRPFAASVVFDNSDTFGNHSNGILTASIPSTIVLAPGGPSVFVDTGRDLVTWMQVTSHMKTLNSSSKDYRRFARREITLRTDNSTQWSGSFAMAGVAKSPTTQNLISWYLDDEANNEGPVSWRFGGRSNLGHPSGRDFIAPMPANPSSLRANFGNFQVSVAKILSATSPYILQPNDHLVFGWQTAWYALSDDGVVPNSAKPALTLLPGPGRITFYGCQLSENVEFHDTVNQPLTSPAVHESLHFDNPVTDQFDIELLPQFSGSVFAEFISGAISTLPSSRGVAASLVVSGDIHTPGDRFFDHERKRGLINGSVRIKKCISSNERFFDTLVPSAYAITNLNGSFIWRSGDVSIIVLGHHISGGLAVFVPGAIDETWNLAFPFEPRYSTVPRLLTNGLKVSPTRESVDSSILVDHPPLEKVAILRTNKRSSSGFFYDYSTPTSFFLSDEAEFNTDYFGIGDNLSGTCEPSVILSASVVPRGVGGMKPRGFKYGILNSRPQFSDAIWRANYYGQFRDMLEQRLFTKFYDVEGLRSDGTPGGGTGARTAAVTVRFVSASSVAAIDPLSTNSSNLSFEVTSSLPYFDGVSRN